jgi:hypothetical protein
VRACSIIMAIGAHLVRENTEFSQYRAVQFGRGSAEQQLLVLIHFIGFLPYVPIPSPDSPPLRFRPYLGKPDIMYFRDTS